MSVDFLQVVREFHRFESVDREHHLELSNGTISGHSFSSKLTLVTASSIGQGNIITDVCLSTGGGVSVWYHFLTGCLVPCFYYGVSVQRRGSLGELCWGGAGHLCQWGVSVEGGSLSWGVSVLEGSLCRGKEGVSVQEGDLCRDSPRRQNQ